MSQNKELDRFKDTLYTVLINERIDEHSSQEFDDDYLVEQALSLLEEEQIDVETLTEEQLEELFGGRVTNLLMGRGFKTDKQADYAGMSPKQRIAAAKSRIARRRTLDKKTPRPGETPAQQAYRNQQAPNRNRAMRAAAARTKGEKFQEKPVVDKNAEMRAKVARTMGKKVPAGKPKKRKI
jgi:hypothetical protein